MKKYTLVDIAKITGYSKTTISRVLNGKTEQYRISNIAKERIISVVHELNYQPNILAQNLRKHITHTIGLIIPHIDNPFFANIASTIITEAMHYEYTVILIDTLDDTDLEKKAITSLLARNIDGIIVVPCGDNPSELEEVNKTTPVVLVDRYFKNCDIPYVSTNNYIGSYLATKFLLEMGHRNILCIQGPPISITTQERIRGCNDAVKEYDDVDGLIIRGEEFSIRSGYIETKMAVVQKKMPTVIFALSNMILLGAMKALSEHGLKIPDDISLISFDDNLYLDYLNPPITRIVQPLKDIGIIAVKMLMEIISKKSNINSNILIQPTIIKRDSVKILL